MRTLAITQNVTLDGAVEFLGDWFDPAEPADGDGADQHAEMLRQDEDCDAVLLGRQTFTDFRGYWPLQTDDTTGITDYLNQVQKYVVSSTLTDPEWQHSTILAPADGDVVEQVRGLKEQPGRDIVLTGSITLAHTLIAAGLVDEYRLFTYPVVQGAGRRLFPEGFEASALDVVDVQRFGNGVVLTRYRSS